MLKQARITNQNLFLMQSKCLQLRKCKRFLWQIIRQLKKIRNKVLFLMKKTKWSSIKISKIAHLIRLKEMDWIAINNHNRNTNHHSILIYKKQIIITTLSMVLIRFNKSLLMKKRQNKLLTILQYNLKIITKLIQK